MTMPQRPTLTHLLAIGLALAALAAGVWYYTNASDPVPGLPENPQPIVVDEGPQAKEACEEAGGVWNECASACPPDAEACVLMCVQKCEGIDDGKQVVEVYFPNSALDPEHLDCSLVFPVRRAVIDDPELEGRAAVEALLAGPTEEEKAEGYFTPFPDGVTLETLTMQGATARADFSAELKQVAGSCRVLSIRAQIEETLMQFPEAATVIISVDGSVDEALQP